MGGSMKIKWYDILLYKFGLARKKKGTLTMIHAGGIVDCDGGELPLLDNLIYLVSILAVEKNSKNLDGQIKGARAQMLYDETLSFLDEKMEELKIK